MLQLYHECLFKNWFIRKCKVAASKRLSWRGLWLLTLLLYTDVVNTSISILRCPMLRNSDGQQSLVTE